MAPVELDPDRITRVVQRILRCASTAPARPGARDVDLSGADIDVIVDLGSATAQATIRTTDLSHAYVEENSAYSS